MRPLTARDENAQSVGSVITYGQFRVIDLGDLLWNNEIELMCPVNPIGTVDLYMVTHHGQDSSGSEALVHGVRPRVAVMQNGTRKGAAPAAMQILRSSPGLEDIWQLHWSYPAASSTTAPACSSRTSTSRRRLRRCSTGHVARRRPAAAAHAPAHAIRISAEQYRHVHRHQHADGFSKTYVKNETTLRA